MHNPTANAPDAPDAPGPQPSYESSGDELVEEELLVEEISIDGMCGVY